MTSDDDYDYNNNVHTQMHTDKLAYKSCIVIICLHVHELHIAIIQLTHVPLIIIILHTHACVH